MKFQRVLGEIILDLGRVTKLPYIQKTRRELLEACTLLIVKSEKKRDLASVDIVSGILEIYSISSPFPLFLFLSVGFALGTQHLCQMFSEC